VIHRDPDTWQGAGGHGFFQRQFAALRVPDQGCVQHDGDDAGYEADDGPGGRRPVAGSGQGIALLANALSSGSQVRPQGVALAVWWGTRGMTDGAQ
jgi:hypothetical protein